MSSEEIEEAEAPSISRRIPLSATLVLLAFFLFLQLLSWISVHGGFMSIVSALALIHSKPPNIDIDESGLEFPLMFVGWLFAIIFFSIFNQKINSFTRTMASLTAAVTVGGGLVLNDVYGMSIITHYMANQGYSRCLAGDWAQGNGKGRVWFADYARGAVDCRKHIS
jgi:hypothetical protein